jgi:hypothetical protein
MYNKVVFFSHQSILVLPSEIYFTQESYGPAYYQIILGIKSVIDRGHSFVFNWRYQEAMFAVKCIPSDLPSQSRTKV